MKKCSSMSPAFLRNRILIFILLLSALPRNILARADPYSDSNSSAKAYFANPPSNFDLEAIPTFELGSIQDIAWTTNLDCYNISIWQRTTGNVSSMGGGSDGESESISVNIQGGNIFAQTTANERVNTFAWVVQTYSLDLALSSIFYLSIEGDATSTSGDFNITTSPPSSSSNSSNTASPAPNPASTETSSSLTSTGKIALGLGVGVGAPLITLLAILAYFQYRSGRHAYMLTESQSQLYSHPPSGLGLGLGLGGMGYPSPSAPAPAPAMDQLAVPPSIPTLFRNPNLNTVQNPAELMPRLPRPVQVQPWEIDANPRFYSPTPAASPPPPPPLGSSGERSASATDENGNRNERSMSRSTTNSDRNSARSASTSTSTSTSSSARARSMSRTRGTRAGVGSGAIEIPELPGESYNFI
ncbi:hypothetical protein BDW60DRAFT_46204 [Aspergillus nidulans var. acristatus]